MSLRTVIGAACAGFLSLSACTLGSQVLPVGKQCGSDEDCPIETECVAADSPNADRVCMPLDEEEPGQSG